MCRYFWLLQLGKDATGIWWVETRGALSILQYTGQLLTIKTSLTSDVNSAETEKLGVVSVT